MNFETRDRSGQLVPELPQPQSSRSASQDLAGDRRVVDARGDAGEARPPTPQKRGPSGLPLESQAPARADEHVEHADTERRDEPRRGMPRRRPFVFVGGLILLFLALGCRELEVAYAAMSVAALVAAVRS
jgi:hypothetical protein